VDGRTTENDLEETAPLVSEYTPIPGNEGSEPAGPMAAVSLSMQDKWRLVRPLLRPYMLPLSKIQSGRLLMAQLGLNI
jgi:hypothetical protein